MSVNLEQSLSFIWPLVVQAALVTLFQCLMGIAILYGARKLLTHESTRPDDQRAQGTVSSCLASIFGCIIDLVIIIAALVEIVEAHRSTSKQAIDPESNATSKPITTSQQSTPGTASQNEDHSQKDGKSASTVNNAVKLGTNEPISRSSEAGDDQEMCSEYTAEAAMRRLPELNSLLRQNGFIIKDAYFVEVKTCDEEDSDSSISSESGMEAKKENIDRVAKSATRSDSKSFPSTEKN